MELDEIFKAIPGPDPIAAAQARRRWDSLAKPLGGLGLLEEQIVRIAALTGSEEVLLDNRALLVLCADNGVTAQGVSQCDAGVTASVARSLAAGSSTVCHMAAAAHCRVIPVDMGILDFPPVEGILRRRIANGTGDITLAPALTREECIAAIETGIALVHECKRDGVQLLATGEMGIGNTTTTSAVTAVLLNLPAPAVTGRGAGLSRSALERKIAVVESAIRRSCPDPDDPIDVLSQVGGLDLAGLCGVFLGGALYRIPVIIDGAISAAAALCALRLCPNAGSAMLASHVSSEPSGRLLLDALGLKAPICAEMHAGEGTGAVAAIPLLDLALAVYHSGHTFSHLGIPAYIPQQ